jgi:hypothetical protein
MAARPATRKRGFHGRVALSLFAFLAITAFAFLNVTDPYAGATASPYYQPAAADPSSRLVQDVALDPDYQLSTISRDNFTITDAPKPVVVPAPTTSSSGGSSKLGAAAVPDPGSAQAYAYSAVQARGWGEDQYSCLVSLWNRESGWRVNAANSSGAYGIPQALPGSKMASAGADWETSAATQIEWGLGYITGRYGTPCGAWASSEDRGWY